MTGMKSWMSAVWRQCAATTRTCQPFLEIVRRSCCSTVWSAYLPAPASVLRMYVTTTAHTWCGTHRKGHSMWCNYRVRWIIVCHTVIVLIGGVTAYPASIFLQSLCSQKVAVAGKACHSSTEAFRSLTLIHLLAWSVICSHSLNVLKVLHCTPCACPWLCMKDVIIAGTHWHKDNCIMMPFLQSKCATWNSNCVLPTVHTVQICCSYTWWVCLHVNILVTGGPVVEKS